MLRDSLHNGMLAHEVMDKQSRLEQTATQDSVSAHVFPQEGVIGAMALIEPGTGEVKALAQSRALGSNPARVFVAHPIQDRTDDEMREYADKVLDEILAAVTNGAA